MREHGQQRALEFFSRYELGVSSFIRAFYGSESAGERIITELKKNGLIKLADYLHPKKFNRERVYVPTAKAATFKTMAKGYSDKFPEKVIKEMLRFSFNAAVKEHAGLIRREIDDVLALSVCPQDTREMKHPEHIFLGKEHVRPDIPISGYKYDKRTFYFVVEIDRATEPGESDDPNRHKTIRSMVRQYRDIIKNEIFRTQYGVSNFQIIFATISPHRIKTFFKYVESECDEEIRHLFLATTVVDFMSCDPLPAPTGHMFTRNYERWDGSQFNMKEFLWTSKERVPSLTKLNSDKTS